MYLTHNIGSASALPIIYVLGHRDGRFGDVYIRPVAVNGLMQLKANEEMTIAGKCDRGKEADAIQR